MSPHQVVLASASPRRKELLSLVFRAYNVIPSQFDERLVPPELDARAHVEYSARMKAQDVASAHPGALVIGADTVVVVEGQILGKPTDAAEAARMLRMLAGRTHQVCTGIAVVQGTTEHSAVESTDVTFRDLSDDIISRYVSTGEPMDKAGAYAIQGRGSVLIARIDGCYFNVVGLPLYRLSSLLEHFGIRPLEGQ